ncbi:hypothetical protein BDZ90DRAFT_232887 [Jaminaea rosea]|uniref:Autophagy-related protein 27 n=1 Tax=Jaminaea rosea TaxID=1569628 RepID=A0A316UNB5_9BASI|nr:hypothetical protein BDZ90DRAFT_232887 [Jaminaea rosea]PWN26777.1 hypothetical protein BDZ90DRAFT_232887 [Jaminaea rosea]
MTSSNPSRRSKITQASILLLASMAGADPLTRRAPTASAAALDCAQPLTFGSNQYDLSSLSSLDPVIISAKYDTPPSITTYSLALSLCKPLPSDQSCGSGTRVCQRVSSKLSAGGDDVVNQIIPFYGDGAAYRYELEDVSTDGKEWTLELKGPEYAGRRQKLEIQMSCDPSASVESKPTFKGYDLMEGEGKVSWRTKIACPMSTKDKDGDPAGDGTNPLQPAQGGWGFFSWFFFLIIMGLIIYFVLGTYQNHQKYGVYEIPHRDFWREAPYLVQDAGRHAWKSIAGGSGGGSSGRGSGGYEPL